MGENSSFRGNRDLNIHRLRKIARNIPSLFLGYSIYVDSDKLRLIDRACRSLCPQARSFVDLGGVWKVHGAYSLYALRNHALDRGVLVDTDFPRGLPEKLSRTPRLQVIRGDFASPEVARQARDVDVVFLFDVLLHQANPSWEAVLSLYAESARCFVIYNQQYTKGGSTVRLTDLSLDEYLMVAPRGREDLYRYVYAHADELHPAYGKPWRDIHNIFQWGITDRDLRLRMSRLGFREVYFQNCGRFSNLPAFENHAFVFLRDPTVSSRSSPAA